MGPSVTGEANITNHRPVAVAVGTPHSVISSAKSKVTDSGYSESAVWNDRGKYTQQPCAMPRAATTSSSLWVPPQRQLMRRAERKRYPQSITIMPCPSVKETPICT